MNGNGFLVICAAALAVYMGMTWERARRALFDVRSGRKRVDNLKRAATRERFHAYLVVTAAAAVIFMIAKYQ
ncbi:hypothetical protein [Actinomadura parmotrematis]|uniref:Uncharacterized protein n=1 Tax=Actinomadura parmotrematis TaxID=2864039 RepID=A0ABS7G0Z5_9ACTN|nr:hypothetical protein [Actinomadura parmotrematis]MBW8486161.1 hypothetical protein [Actinomadura parmotrematis]